MQLRSEGTDEIAIARHNELEVNILQERIKTAEETAFRQKPMEAKRPYSTQGTLDLMLDRQKARDRHEGDLERILNRRIKNAVKQDQRRFWKEELEKEDWKEIKGTKKGFVPKHTKIMDKQGTVASSDRRPDILADYFEEKQWGNKKTEEENVVKSTQEFRNNLLFHEQARVNTGQYETWELKTVIKKMKKKAPGPDGIRTDIFNMMDDESLAIILSAINKWRLDKSLPIAMQSGSGHHLQKR